MAAHLDTIPRLSHVALTVPLCFSLMGGLPAQERAAIVQSIDLSVPFPPSTVPIDGRTSLVYELHITNFQSADVALSRLQVVGADRPGRTLVDYGREALMMRLGRPGLPRRYETPHLIGPGMRAVAYLWIELPAGSDPPAVLGHRVELDILPCLAGRAEISPRPVRRRLAMAGRACAATIVPRANGKAGLTPSNGATR